MAEPLAFHLPQDASLHSLNSFNSFDFGFFADASLSDAACGLAAKMAFTQTATGDATRLAPSAEYPTREALANPAPSAADVASARVSGRDGETRETRDEQQLALAGAERALAGEVASTSRDAMEVFPPLDFGDMSVDQQADALFSKGPLRTLSARTFETLLDETSIKENEEWVALQNLPSLPRDMTIDLVDEDTAAPPVPPSSTPTRAVPASAAEELDGEYASYDAPAPASRVEHLDPDEASFASALAAATTARARAEEARRFATQKTAKATALTMQAKELLDVAAGARGEPRPASAAAAAAAAALERESSGLATPNVSERGGGASAFDARGGQDVSSPMSFTEGGGAGRSGKRPRRGVAGAAFSSGRRGDAFAFSRAREGDSTDMEDSDETASTAMARRSRKKPRVAAPQATDNIINADGKQVRRGCLNCGCQKTPQWRMGPEGPKTLCNACGVRFRKGMPMND